MQNVSYHIFDDGYAFITLYATHRHNNDMMVQARCCGLQEFRKTQEPFDNVCEDVVQRPGWLLKRKNSFSSLISEDRGALVL